MRRLLLSVGAGALLLVGGAWWYTRRAPAGALLDLAEGPFSVRGEGAGTFLRFRDAQGPLRAFRWLPPREGGLLAAQVLGQNDRQQVALFRAGAPLATLLVGKPAGVPDGFWRFAALEDALLTPDGSAAILLYRAADPAGGDPALVLALDLAGQTARWSWRGPGDRLAQAGGTDPAVFVFGSGAPVTRLGLVADPAQAGPGGPHPPARTLPLPPEAAPLDDLLPTGGWSFLACHRNGLSIYRGRGWTTLPAPGDPGLPCRDFRSALARTGRAFWWQPAPGRLVQVAADGRILAQWSGRLPAADPLAPDAQLLRLLGADAGGALWFALAVPAPPAPAQVPAPTPVPQEGGAEPVPAEAPPAPGPDWGAFAAQGLDRAYRWDPQRRGLARVDLGRAWAGLHSPGAVAAPATPGQALFPAAGALLAQGPRCAWWLPLAALRLDPAAGSFAPADPAQAR